MIFDVILHQIKWRKSMNSNSIMKILSFALITMVWSIVYSVYIKSPVLNDDWLVSTALIFMYLMLGYQTIMINHNDLNKNEGK